MKNTALSATLAVSITLSGCLGAGDPVELPEDTIEAASTCFAAQGLVLRDARGSDSADITYDEFIAAIKYPLVASTQIDPFSVDSVMQVLTGAEARAEEIATKDYAGAIATCDARFKPAAATALPESDSDAILGCMGMSSFVAGAVQDQGEGFGGDQASITALASRMQEKMTSDPDLLVRMIQGEPEALLQDALQDAFATGDPDGYLKLCEARFPAG